MPEPTRADNRCDLDPETLGANQRSLFLGFDTREQGVSKWGQRSQQLRPCYSLVSHEMAKFLGETIFARETDFKASVPAVEQRRREDAKAGNNQTLTLNL